MHGIYGYWVSEYPLLSSDVLRGGDANLILNPSSLDSISKTFGPVRVDVLGKIAEAVLGGLTYLYRAHKIMHRDIKPSNVLVNSRGQVKLCDFGVSSELDNSVADTFVGTGTYMAPERIQGSPYTVKSDVWSVGLTLMELAIGRFPFSSSSGDDEDDEEAGGPQGILDLLQQIVLEPAPKLPKSDAFPQILEDVIAKCLMKAPEERPTPQELYETDAFLQAAKRTPVDLEQWAISMMEKQKRKSHLVPQLSPATKSLLRGESESAPAAANTNTPSTSSGSASTAPTSERTPTTGEIPIASSHHYPQGKTQTQNTNGTPASHPSSRSPFPPRTTSHTQPPTTTPSTRHQQPQPDYAHSAQQQMNLPIRPPPPLGSGYSSDGAGSSYSNAGVGGGAGPRPSRRVEREREKEREREREREYYQQRDQRGEYRGDGRGEGRVEVVNGGLGPRDVGGREGVGRDLGNRDRDAYGRRAPRPGGVGMGGGGAGNGYS